MIREIEVKVLPEKVDDEHYLREQIFKVLKLKRNRSVDFKILKRSIDARKGRPKFVLRLRVGVDVPVTLDADEIEINYKHVTGSPEVIIVGAGPAGYFAALECLERGLRPIVLDRGKDVRARRRDLKAIQQDDTVNPHSNYCFGEGGAGTYSDGKLYTRAKKRGKIIKTLKLLVDHGAKSDILVDAHPHIGSNKLPKIIAQIRETITKFGGEVRFDNLVTDIIIDKAQCRGVVVNNTEELLCTRVVLATGHSARDIFQLLAAKGVRQEAKPFAIGLRIEHPQALIDEIQYDQRPREANLPAASYKLVTQIDKVGVFSFCMCPGGLIVPAATAPGELVVNGMSLSKRDSPYANSGIVTQISTEELESMGYSGPLGNMEFQQELEQHIFDQGQGGQQAPAQNMIDFVSGQDMIDVNDSSYIPGIYRAPLHEFLPEFIYYRLKQGLNAFSLKMKGYFTNEAHLVAIESRTSSPVRIPRDPTTCQHPEVEGLYPCGEGAGYAGGILSAAMDGQDSSGIKEIYDTYLPKVESILGAMGCTKDEAWEVFQESLIVILKKAQVPGFQLSSSFYTFLVSICKFKWYNESKKKYKKNVTIDQVGTLKVEEDIVDSLNKLERFKLYKEKMAELDPECQQLLELFFLKIPLKEIAVRLGFKSENAAKQKKYKCQKKLIDKIKSDLKYDQLL